MKNIKLYDAVVVNKDIQTESTPSIFVEKGTFGIVLEITTLSSGETIYLVELDDDKYPDGELVDFTEEDIDKK